MDLLLSCRTGLLPSLSSPFLSILSATVEGDLQSSHADSGQHGHGFGDTQGRLPDQGVAADQALGNQESQECWTMGMLRRQRIQRVLSIVCLLMDRKTGPPLQFPFPALFLYV